jgi:hypothetical protein
MLHHFCTTAARKLRRIGYAAKAALRFARIFSVILASVCGLMGVFFCDREELYQPIAGAGRLHADARSGSFLSAAAALRR